MDAVLSVQGFLRPSKEVVFSKFTRLNMLRWLAL